MFPPCNHMISHSTWNMPVLTQDSTWDFPVLKTQLETLMYWLKIWPQTGPYWLDYICMCWLGTTLYWFMSQPWIYLTQDSTWDLSILTQDSTWDLPVWPQSSTRQKKSVLNALRMEIVHLEQSVYFIKKWHFRDPLGVICWNRGVWIPTTLL